MTQYAIGNLLRHVSTLWYRATNPSLLATSDSPTIPYGGFLHEPPAASQLLNNKIPCIFMKSNDSLPCSQKTPKLGLSWARCVQSASCRPMKISVITSIYSYVFLVVSFLPIRLYHLLCGRSVGIALVRTDVSEKLTASFIRVSRICELGTTLAATSNWRTLRRNTKWVHLLCCS
jgi:hypothetical protein